ncbi:MAG TPA: MFS transporter [Thermoanaerobaculia bacterium]|nr:MFS transporter [Thermoanaerobaculia bacterium]
MSDPSATTDNERVSSRAWLLLLFLTALNVLNFVDRTLISSLGPLLIKDLGLSRAQIGLLAGYGFVFFYTLVGLFFGLAADRWRRIPLVSLGVALWSAMTALSGLARSFLQLALPRIFVGVGEATLTPSALSMLGDAFPRRRLATASGIYYAGIPIGTALSLIASSWIAPRWGWRTCFYTLGILGVVAAALLLLVREPARRGSSASEPARTLLELVADVACVLRARSELLLVLLGGSLLCYGSASGLLTLTWLVEDRKLPFAVAAFRAGVIAVVAGFLGNLVCGWFADWCARRWTSGRMGSLAVFSVAFAGSAALFYSLPAGTVPFYVSWFATAACSSGFFGPFFAAVQELSPAQARSTTLAFALLSINLLGVGPGPLITGRIGDLRGLTSGLLVSVAVIILAVVPFVLAARRFRGERTS